MPRPVFQPLPSPTTRDGAPRTVGVEIEFSGLSVDAAAGILSEALDGPVERIAPHNVEIESRTYGTFELELDSAYLKPTDTENTTLQMIDAKVKQVAGDVAEALVPVELIAPPLEVAQLDVVQELSDRLAASGASGTDTSIFYAFGVHLNPQVVSLQADDVLPVLRAYAFVEPWLRHTLALDMSRRVTPFIDPFPDAYRHWLSQNPKAAWDAIIDAYISHNPSRNRGLDMMPILLTVDADRVEAQLTNTKKNARPTYHFRLPNARLGDSDWSLQEAWDAWVHVERIAECEAAVAQLADYWGNATPSLLSGDPTDDIESVLQRFDLGRDARNHVAKSSDPSLVAK